MAADSQISLTISMVMIALFTVAIIGFSIGFANDTRANISIINDPELTALNTNTNANLSTFKTDSEGTYQSILESTIEPGSDVTQSSGPFAITPLNILGVMKNIIWLPYKKIFGEGEGFGIFFTVFIAFLVFIIGLLVWKTWKGNP